MNQRPPSDINSSVGPHQRGSSIEKAINWHLKNKWIDDPHRQNQNQNDMQRKTTFNYRIDRRMASDVIIYKFPQQGCGSKGRALVPHARGTRIDAPHLQLFRQDRKSGNKHYGKLFCQIEKKTSISTSNTRRKASETALLNENAIGGPNRQCLPYKDVEGNTVLLTCESKTSLWHK